MIKVPKNLDLHYGSRQCMVVARKNEKTTVKVAFNNNFNK